MKRNLNLRACIGLMGCLVAAGLSAGPAWPQGAPAPVQSAPLAPPAATDAAPPASTPPALPTTPAPAAPAAPAGTVANRPTLVPKPGDPVDVDEVVLPAKTAAILSGMSTWDEGFENLKKGFQRIEDELKKAGLTPSGRPLTLFVQTDDLGFRYEAMVPVEGVAEGRATLTPEIRFGKTPEGRALRFVHKAPYEEIDSTYETIAAYLDAKDVEVKESFVEEYVTDLTSVSDPNLEINIFALPK